MHDKELVPYTSSCLPSLPRAAPQPKKNSRKKKKSCIDRESNPGPVDGNDGFYH